MYLEGELERVRVSDRGCRKRVSPRRYSVRMVWCPTVTDIGEGGEVVGEGVAVRIDGVEVSEECVVQRRRRWTSRRWQPPFSIGLGLGRWGGGSEPRNPSHWPPPPIYGTARWGPTSRAWA
jgi:hypothetical protein